MRQEASNSSLLHVTAVIILDDVVIILDDVVIKARVANCARGFYYTLSTSVNTGLSSARGRDVQGSFAVEEIELLGPVLPHPL